MESEINGCYEVIKFLAHLFRDEIKCFVERTEKALLIAKTKKFNLVGTLRNVQKGYERLKYRVRGRCWAWQK